MDSIKLLQQAADGNHSAYKELFQHYLPRLSRIFYDFTGQSVQDTEDILQEVFTSIYKSRHNFTTMQELDGFVFTAARNRIFNLIKRENLSHRWHKKFYESLGQAYKDADEALSRKQYYSLARKIIDALPKVKRDALLLKIHEGLSADQIAVRLNISKAAARERLDQAKKIVIQQLLEQGKWMVLLLWIRWL